MPAAPEDPIAQSPPDGGEVFSDQPGATAPIDGASRRPARPDRLRQSVSRRVEARQDFVRNQRESRAETLRGRRATDPDPGEIIDHAVVDPGDGRIDTRELLNRPLTERPTVRAGFYAWATIGITIVIIGLSIVVSTLSAVILPLVLALFPAAVLYPVARRLKTAGWPDALAAAAVLLATLGIIGGIGAFIAPQLAGQLDSLSDSIQAGYDQVDSFLASGPFGLEPVNLQELIDGFRSGLQGGVGAAAGNALGFAKAFFEGATSVLLALIVLFFYLKDGPSIARWVKSLFPHYLHPDVDTLGGLVWGTIGGYIQGQLIVAMVDAVFIGLGLWILGVPLALPLGVIVFFGGLFPVVGAGIAGLLATLVALATNGPGTALLVIAVVITVQVLEGNLLQPLILGRTLELHPLAIVVALAIGGFLLGILGAFLAVPVAAATSQTVGYIRNRTPG